VAQAPRAHLLRCGPEGLRRKRPRSSVPQGGRDGPRRKRLGPDRASAQAPRSRSASAQAPWLPFRRGPSSGRPKPLVRWSRASLLASAQAPGPILVRVQGSRSRRERLDVSSVAQRSFVGRGASALPFVRPPVLRTSCGARTLRSRSGARMLRGLPGRKHLGSPRRPHPDSRDARPRARGADPPVGPWVPALRLHPQSREAPRWGTRTSHDIRATRARPPSWLRPSPEGLRFHLPGAVWRRGRSARRPCGSSTVGCRPSRGPWTGKPGAQPAQR
jgi:hypothetical protein